MGFWVDFGLRCESFLKLEDGGRIEDFFWFGDLEKRMIVAGGIFWGRCRIGNMLGVDAMFYLGFGRDKFNFIFDKLDAKYGKF